MRAVHTPHILAGIALLWLMATPASAQQVKLSLEASTAEARVGDRIELRFEASAAGGELEELELPLPEDAFEVVGRAVSRPMSFSFGFSFGQGAQQQIRTQSSYRYTLRALKPGSYTLGPGRVRLGKRSFTSNSVRITVSGTALKPAPSAPDSPSDSAATTSSAEAPPEVDVYRYDPQGFLRLTLSKARPYVGEQLIFRVLLYLPQRLRSSPSFTKEPGTEDFWSQSLDQPGQRTREGSAQVRKRFFRVYELRRQALFPLKAGKAVIRSPRLKLDSGSLFDLLQGARRDRSLASPRVELKVRPLPKGSPEGTLVGKTQVKATLSPDTLRTGDATTLSLQLTTFGNAALTELSLPQLPEGLEALAPESSTESLESEAQLKQIRRQEWVIVARKPGSYRIPSLELPSFDPLAGRLVTHKTRELTLKVTGTSLSGGPRAEDPEAEDAPAPAPKERAKQMLPEPPAAAAAWEHALARIPWAGLIALALLPWLLWALVRTARYAYGRFRDAPQRQLIQAVAALRQLPEATSAETQLAQVQHAIGCALHYRTGTPPQDTRVLSRHALEALCEQDPELRQVLVEAYEAYAHARYGQVDTQAAKQAALEALDRLCEARPAASAKATVATLVFLSVSALTSNVEAQANASYTQAVAKAASGEPLAAYALAMRAQALAPSEWRFSEASEVLRARLEPVPANTRRLRPPRGTLTRLAALASPATSVVLCILAAWLALAVKYLVPRRGRITFVSSLVGLACLASGVRWAQLRSTADATRLAIITTPCTAHVAALGDQAGQTLASGSVGRLGERTGQRLAMHFEGGTRYWLAERCVRPLEAFARTPQDRED